MTGSGDAKCLIIHFQTMETCNACIGAAHQQFPDLVFHAHDPKQLRSDEDLQAIQVIDIPFFLTKENIMSYFKKFGNIASCRVYSRRNAKVQQARIIYDSAYSIARFNTQWAVYCFSTCLRVTPCHYTVDQKSSHHEFVATFTQLPPNTKDIKLAPLTRDLGAKAVNIPLSLNSCKPKRWAYVTFNSQEAMDAAMEQIIGFRGHTLQWNLPDNTNKLCHRCGKLGCAPNQCPSCQERGHTRGRNPVAALKERFNINQPARPKERSCSSSRSRSRSKVSFSMVLRIFPSLSTPNQAITMSPHEAANILSLLKSLQQDMAEVRDRITVLELNNRRMTRIEQHLGLLPPPDIPATNQTSDMLIDAPAISDSTDTLVTPISAPIDLSNTSSPSSTSQAVPSFTQTCDKIQAINAKHSAIENKLDMLASSISSFIGSITSSSSSLNSASTAGSN
ncbi:hypothetical protein RclHR1_31190002 [Rhizophagus clarus]|uniref:RRM domain-containing protein n=1 Tax=Rhizophagus clarus TaxID=94130 RepID=A0A2Z6R723_9GLOM|nr:hypothetical protein RclHR1_31190002 [Rhizophagus clarus]